MRTDRSERETAACHPEAAPRCAMVRAFAVMILLLPGMAESGPSVAAGDVLLRHDIQVLADHGILAGTVSTWPLSWGPILEALHRSRDRPLSAAARAAAERIGRRARWETRQNYLSYSAQAGVATNPSRIRGFQDTPRDDVQLGAGLSWTGDWLTLTLRGQLVDTEGGTTDTWMDGSEIGVVLGNWALSLNTLDRWWGPGWDGSTILSNNARPIPAVTLGRVFTEPFQSRWLSWLGHWDLTLVSGQLESSRQVSDALFFGARFNFRPLDSLEIGLSRTAQWCGDDRPCDVDTFFDLLAGRDNVEGGLQENRTEPGNQLAGLDFRWSLFGLGLPAAIYGQVTGEDEAGNFPSRYIGQFGVELSGIHNGWTWRWFGEFAGTSCQFHESSKRFNCAYNHGIYQTGYRYRGRSIGHGAENDAEMFSMGLLLAGDTGSQLDLTFRSGTLNQGGQPDVRNTLTSTPLDINSADVRYRHFFRYGLLEFSAGFERTEAADGNSDTDSRYYIMWRSAY